MCFFVYSPQHNLSLQYASEKIHPYEKKHESLWYGTSKLEVDMILQNDGLRQELSTSLDSEINKFFIIYPNILFQYNKQSESVELINENIFKDITKQFITESYELSLKRRDLNSTALLSNKFTTSYVDNLVIEPIDISADHYKIAIDIPNPNNLATETIKSEIFGNVDIKLIESLPGLDSKRLYHILENILSMTILECTFDNPLEKGKSRWVKFEIQPKSTSFSTAITKRSRAFKRFYNANSYSYEIKGPYNVYYEFFNKIYSWLEVLHNFKSNIDLSGADIVVDNQKISPKEYRELLSEYLLVIEQILKKIRSHIGDYYNTHCIDWRLEIFSNRGKIYDIREYGIFRISGSLSSVIELPDGKLESVFTWKSGRKNVCIKEEEVPNWCGVFKKMMELECDKIGCNIKPQNCFPYAGNFRIAYEWKKDSLLFQCAIVIITFFSILAAIPLLKDFYNAAEKFFVAYLF